MSLQGYAQNLSHPLSSHQNQQSTPLSTNAMPPRKKTAKGSVRAPSTPAADEDAMAIDTPQPSEPPKPSDLEPAQPAEPAYDITKDPWTDEQETSLYKGIIKWKPAGTQLFLSTPYQSEQEEYC